MAVMTKDIEVQNGFLLFIFFLSSRIHREKVREGMEFLKLSFFSLLPSLAENYSQGRAPDNNTEEDAGVVLEFFSSISSLRGMLSSVRR